MLTKLFNKRHRAIDVLLFVSSWIRHNYPNVGNKIIKTDTRGTRQLTPGKAFKLLLLFKDNRQTFFFSFSNTRFFFAFYRLLLSLSFSTSFFFSLLSFIVIFCIFFVFFLLLYFNLCSSFSHSRFSLCFFSDMFHFIDLPTIGFYLFFLD